MVRWSEIAMAIASILFSFYGFHGADGWMARTAPQRPSLRLCQLQASSSSSSSSSSIPPGRVQDVDQWIQWCSDSLQKFRGISLLVYMQVDSVAEVHTHERYAVLSHGTQDDPIFCYANTATLRTFQYTEMEFYQLPSRKSAPVVGGERETRQTIMKDVDNQQVLDIATGIRQRKDGSLFEFRNVIYWNVYNDAAERVGQCAVFDTAQIKESTCIVVASTDDSQARSGKDDDL